MIIPVKNLKVKPGLQGMLTWTTIRCMDIHAAISRLQIAYSSWKTPAVSIIALCERSPYKVLISCIISLRTKDEVTALASARLFAEAGTPEAMCHLSPEKIAHLIYPAGFYRTKSIQIHDISRRLQEEYGGIVPDEIDELLRFKGVGRKTANLVVTLGYGKPGICVDTHVHRICNRWGYVTTGTPEQTEMALRKILPTQYWLLINDLLVAFGQNHCYPVSPCCSTCCLALLCPRIGVGRFR